MSDRVLVSNCHLAPVKLVEGDNDNNHYECEQCGQNCVAQDIPAVGMSGDLRGE